MSLANAGIRAFRHIVGPLAVTAEEWLAAISVSRNVLAIFGNVRETLVDWTRVGATTAYSVSWASQTHPGEPKSAYRHITGVLVDDVALDEAGSLLCVQLNPGTWFWDSATETLYVSTATGVSPGTFSWVGATFELFFSTAAIADDVLYEPRITGSVPAIQSEEYDLTLGSTSSMVGTLSLTNGDAFFDDLSQRYIWHNASVQIRCGGGDMAIADYVDVGQLQVIGPPAPSDDVCTFQLRAFDNQSRNRAFPLHTYDDKWGALIGAPYPAELAGQFMPMLWGRVKDIPLTLLDIDGDGNADYTFVDLLQTATAVATACRAIDRTTGEVSEMPSTDWFCSAGHVFVVNATWPAASYTFAVDAERESGGPMTSGAIAKDILTLIGVSADMIDDDAFDAADAEWPAVLSIYLPGGAAPDVFTSCGALLRAVEQASLGRVAIGTDGRWTMDIYDPSLPSDAPELPEELMTQFTASNNAQEVMVRTMRVQYALRFRAQSWDTVTAGAGADGYAYQTTETLNVAVGLADEHDATLLAGRLAWMNSLPTIRVDIDGPPVAFLLQTRDKVRVVRERAPSATGGWTGAGMSMEVESVSVRPSDCRALITVGNMRGIGPVIKRAAPNGTPDWDDASSLERLLYGFSHDNDTERVVSSDPSTFHQFMSW